jgi:hypothetical protein
MPEIEATGAQKEEAAKLGEERGREIEIGESVDFGREAPGAVCTGGGICVVVLLQCFFFRVFFVCSQSGHRPWEDEEKVAIILWKI